MAIFELFFYLYYYMAIVLLWVHRNGRATVLLWVFGTEQLMHFMVTKRQFRSQFSERKGNGRLFGRTERNPCNQTGS